MEDFERGWNESDSLISDKEGEIIKSSRKFGVEVECQFDDMDDMQAVMEEINENIGVGEDGSINTEDNYSAEFRTPPASGDKAEEMINIFTGSLNQHDFRVDDSCGLHVHIDATDLRKVIKTPEGSNCLRNYWLFYIAMDEVIRSFLPASRRRNHFCRPSEPVYNAVRGAKTYEDLREIYRSGDSKFLDPNCNVAVKDPTRYRGINLIPLFDQWHAEIRYHNGTIQGDRILHWASLHLTIFDKIMDGTITVEWIDEMRDTKSVAKRSKALYQILDLSKNTEAYLKARQVKFSTQMARLLNNKVVDNLRLLTQNVN